MKTTDWRDALRSISPDSLAEAPQEELKEEAAEESPVKASSPHLKVIVEKRSGGKVATIISGFDYDDPRAQEVAAALKRQLAVGGSVRDGEILIQGDRRQKVVDALKSMGYKAK